MYDFSIMAYFQIWLLLVFLLFLGLLQPANQKDSCTYSAYGQQCLSSECLNCLFFKCYIALNFCLKLKKATLQSDLYLLLSLKFSSL